MVRKSLTGVVGSQPNSRRQSKILLPALTGQAPAVLFEVRDSLTLDEFFSGCPG